MQFVSLPEEEHQIMETIINYCIEKRNLPASKGEVFAGRILHRQVIRQEGLIDIMVHRNTTLSRQDIIGVLDLFQEVVLDNIEKGNMVSTPLFRTGFSLKGEFLSLTDKIDYRKHKPRVTIRLARGISARLMRGVRLHRKRNKGEGFYIRELRRLGAKDETNLFSPGDVIEIRGKGLRVYHCPAQYAIQLCRNEKTVAELPVISLDNGKAVTQILPSVQPGQYKVVLLKKFNNTERRAESARVSVG